MCNWYSVGAFSIGPIQLEDKNAIIYWYRERSEVMALLALAIGYMYIYIYIYSHF